MTSRRRVQATLQHRQPDKVPIDFGGTLVTGMHVTCVAALRDHYGLEKRPVKVYEPYQMLGFIEDDLAAIIGVDVIGVNPRNTLFGFPNEDWRPWRLENGLEVLVPGQFRTTTDAAGDIFIYPGGDLSAPPSGRLPKGGFYFDTIIRQEQLDEDRLDPADNLEEFTKISDADLAYFTGEIERAHATGKSVLANFGGTGLGDIALVPAPFMKHPKGIRDVAEWYMATSARPEYVQAVFDQQTDIALHNLDRLNQAVGDKVDAIFGCGTDFGTQIGTFCSADTFRRLYLPYYKKMNDWIHQHTNWKVFKHSCGAVASFVPLFVQAGFDILNPVQCSAAGMDAATLKARHGREVVFWGGGVDTQKTLPFGTPAAVREEVLRRCEIFAPNGGFVFNAIHNVQARTPVANIVAMLDAVHQFNS